LAHGEDVFLHCLHPSTISLSESIAAAYSTEAPLRYQDFAALMDAAMLRIPKHSADSEPLLTLQHTAAYSTAPVERQTRYFPVSSAETLLFAPDQTQDLHSLLDPLKQSFLQDELSNSELETGIAVPLLFLN
jgi:hypothetical protein